MTTIKDVARLSGVSTTTVSEVLNKGWRPVHPDTQQRVMEAAQQLDYRPNALARGLVGKRMNTIGVVFTQWDAPHISPFVLGALLGVLSQGGSHQQNTMLFNLDYWGRAHERIREMCDGRCDGLLLMVPPEDCPLLELLQRSKMPCALVGARDPSGQSPSVDVDNYGAAFQMTNTLLQMGHRRIGFVYDHNTQDFFTSFARERHEGYRQAMLGAGMYDPAIGNLSGASTAIEVARSSQRPTAFFCLQDVLALYLLEQLQRVGVRVPNDVSVAGFDDIPFAAMSQPTLSTVRQPINQLGECATEMLLAIIDGDISPGHRKLLPTQTVLRGSTAPPSM